MNPRSRSCDSLYRNWAHHGLIENKKSEFMVSICVEYQTPADDPTLLGSPHTVSMYYEVESQPEAWQIAKHYKANNVKCDPTTIVVKELSKKIVERLRAEGVAFHKIGKF